LVDTLEALRNATEEQKEARGIRYTPREILQQPSSWRKTFQLVRNVKMIYGNS
jgi:hypothetical protein